MKDKTVRTVILFCLTAGALDALQSYLQGRVGARDPATWQFILFQGAEWIFLAALTPIAYTLGQRFPLRRPNLVRAGAVHLLGALMLCTGWATLGVLLRRGLGARSQPFALDLTSWLLTSLPWSFFMYFAMLGCLHAFAYYLALREREAQTARLMAQLSEARLQALRMQLHPHFLFNSLNAITVLVRDQKTKVAARMLELLSDMLRQILRSDLPQHVPVADELKLVEQYLAMEQIRFSDRLQVRYSVDREALTVPVPRFILQPLVENALRHGVAGNVSTAAIEIGVVRRNTDLELWVRDNGHGAAERNAPAGHGVGLENTRQRLATLYGDAASLTFSLAQGGAIASIKLPQQPATAQGVSRV